jgi:hypothetical protein
VKVLLQLWSNEAQQRFWQEAKLAPSVPTSLETVAP